MVKETAYPITHSALNTLTHLKKLKDDLVLPTPSGNLQCLLDLDYLHRMIADLKSVPLIYKRGNFQLLFCLEQNRMIPFYDEAIRRITRETNYFHEYEEVGLLVDTTFQGITNGMFRRSRVTWNYPSSQLRGGAEFVPKNDSIHIQHGPPRVADILEGITKDMRVPWKLGALLHEVVHSYQDTYIDYLSEAQSFRADNYPPHIASKDMVVEAITWAKDKKGGNLYDVPRREILMYAVTAIDQLNALGFSIPQVGRVLGWHGEWDESNKCYPGLEYTINKRASELGLDKLGLEKLVEVDKAEREIDSLRARIIAQEVLKYAYIHLHSNNNGVRKLRSLA